MPQNVDQSAAGPPSGERDIVNPGAVRCVNLLALGYALSARAAHDEPLSKLKQAADERDPASGPPPALVLDDPKQVPQLVPRAKVFVLSAQGDAESGNGLHEWLGSAAAGAPPELFVLISPLPLTSPGPRSPARALLLGALHRRFLGQRDRLLILSGGGDLHELRALSTPSGGIIGHELVVRGRRRRVLPRLALLEHGLREWRAGRAERERRNRDLDAERQLREARAKPGAAAAEPSLASLGHALLSRSLGRAAQPGFAELHFKPVHEGVPEVRVFFHLAGNTRSAELATFQAGARSAAARLERALRIDPARNGALLSVEPRPPRSEDLVQRCLTLQGPDRLEALMIAERDAVLGRRKRRMQRSDDPDPGAGETKVAENGAAELDGAFAGLALSGGGIRSATVSLGFMRELQAENQLSGYDYVSSVSGGSYANGYLQVMTTNTLLALMGKQIEPKQNERQADPKAMFDQAFEASNIEVLHRHGSYLAPGTGVSEKYNLLRLGTSFLTSLLQHWLWLLAVAVLLGWYGARLAAVPRWWGATLLAGGVCVATRLLLSRDWGYRPREQRVLENALNHVETVFLCWFVLGAALQALAGLPGVLHGWIQGNDLRHDVAAWFVELWPFAGAHPSVLLWSLVVLLTLITSPNATSLHRYYSARLADAFLLGARSRERIKALRRVLAQHDHEIFPLRILDQDDAFGPYPLFNGCLNLAGDDPAFAGEQTGDYFLFSPRFCGAKLTGYASTARGQQYSKLSLAEAITCSGAAISPFQGRSLPSAISTLLWFFNLRTDLWLPNPANRRPRWLARVLGERTVTVGPLRQLNALRGSLSTKSRFVNVSDGAFIDSLGVYELLRRRCSVIVALDATMDPHYDFHDLRNLIRRAHQELGVEFEFKERPEDVIRPDTTTGISERCVVHAQIIWPREERLPNADFYYVKSAVLRDAFTSGGMSAPARAYATYHPQFPQESTGDQFFDPVQWQAYHDLGRRMGREFLRLRTPPSGASMEVLAAE